MPRLDELAAVYVGTSPVVAAYVGSTPILFAGGGGGGISDAVATDAWEDAPTINVTTAGSVFGTTEGATPDNAPTIEGNFTHSVWYKFTPSKSGLVTFTLYSDIPAENSQHDMYLFSGSSPFDAELLGYPDLEVPAHFSTLVVAGVEYHLMVAGYTNDDTESYAVEWTFVSVSNDDIARAQEITIDGLGSVSLTMGNTTVEPDEQTDYTSTQRSVWLTFVAEDDGLVTLDTLESEEDVALDIFSGTPDALVPVAADDDTGGGPNYAALVTFPVTNGTRYYIRVGDYGDADPGNATVVVNWAWALT